MCVKHTDNFSEKLQKWLKSVLTNTTHLGFHINGPTGGGLPSSSGIITATPSFRCENANSAKNISKGKRDKLQKGEIAMDMSDDELIPFFKNDLKKSPGGSQPNVREIPDGDVMFTMCVFQGKTRPVLAFMDSGCNVWVANEEVPAKELRAVKLKQGPIGMGVASGITIQASAEWAALIPLADGGNQIVRGLTLMRVTGDMPKVNMKKLFNAVKTTYGSTPDIDKLDVPESISGKVDMIIGVKYNSIYPELVHQYPNGLAIYKSKLLPCSKKAVACFGGPVGALEGMMEAVGDHATLHHMTQLAMAMDGYKTRVDFFPKMDERNIFDIQDPDLPGIHELIESEISTENENQPEENFLELKVSMKSSSN